MYFKQTNICLLNKHVHLLLWEKTNLPLTASNSSSSFCFKPASSSICFLKSNISSASFWQPLIIPNQSNHACIIEWSNKSVLFVWISSPTQNQFLNCTVVQGYLPLFHITESTYIFQFLILFHDGPQFTSSCKDFLLQFLAIIPLSLQLIHCLFPLAFKIFLQLFLIIYIYTQMK